MFRVNGYIKFTEKDSWENGCEPNTPNKTQQGYSYYHVQNESLEGLIEYLMKDFKIRDKEDVLLDSCDELGRVDLQRYETLNGRVATAIDMELFKAGKMDLWLSTIILRIEENKVADLSKLEGYSRM